MNPSRYRWIIAEPESAALSRLLDSLPIEGLLARCLLNRGFCDPSEAAAFLDPALKGLKDPFLLPGMASAVERLIAARSADERLVLFGDYDVDGVSSCALLVEGMTRLGWRVATYLPHRMDEGYGLSPDGAANCLEKHPCSLLLAVDCGSTAIETIAWLKGRGVDVIVLDHHQVSDPLPAAVALVNPQLGNRDAEGAGTSDFRELCSAGLAFKLLHALTKRGRELGWPEATALDIRTFLDLAALGTIADLVPLIGENRILVSAGLPRLTNTTRPGLIALKEAAGLEGPIGVRDVGFGLGPRLNAAGRLENADEALRLLLAPDAAVAMPIAMSLDTRNRERQRIEKEITAQVIGAVKARFNPETDHVIVEGQMLWHIGVVGIVASRVLQEFYRPTIILGGDGESWRGSGRSIEGFDLAAALRRCDDLLVKHGGHAMAAGVTIRPDKVDEFRQRLNGIAREMLSGEQLKPALRLDAAVSLGDVDLAVLERLSRLQPHGMENPPIQFASRNVTLAKPPQRMGKESQHARLMLRDATGSAEAVWWNCAGKPLPDGRFDIAFAPERNDYNGQTRLQLRLLDWRPAA